ncbi:uncharacterized protein SRS1_15689 [Sporisorium reilianum f. sp. reilianum]|uniref:Uncharacterized protein n=1 Tax=Sporisorium reilianum f. sp. reilianum TaxID=72559 RepID=A0A2N8UKX4_9BASI|nr:uncharacterized protein SRS1_15689 [Sporisorium reilianum f. sp. reilianum]
MDALSPADIVFLIEFLCLLNDVTLILLARHRALLEVVVRVILLCRPAASAATDDPSTPHTGCHDVFGSPGYTALSASNAVATSNVVSVVAEVDSGRPIGATIPTVTRAVTITVKMDTSLPRSPVAVAQSTSDTHPDQPASIVAQSRAPPAILLPGTNLSSVDFCHPARFRIVGGSDEEPVPLNMVVKVKRNYFNDESGKTNFRIVIVDIGDGKEMRMTVKHGADIYDLDRHNNPAPPGTIVVLHNVQGKPGWGKKSLVYTVRSSMTKLRTPIEWQDVLRWHQDISDQSRA